MYMLHGNIEAEYERHLWKVRQHLFDEFTERSNVEIARLSKYGVLPSRMEDPIARASVFFDLIETQYAFKLRECVEYVKSLFWKHNIEFRLLDIHECLHGYHRFTMAWATADRKEYILDVVFDSKQDEPFESFYRLGQIDPCGTATNGDILDQNSFNSFEDSKDLPDWFVKGLQRNS